MFKLSGLFVLSSLQQTILNCSPNTPKKFNLAYNPLKLECDMISCPYTNGCKFRSVGLSYAQPFYLLTPVTRPYLSLFSLSHSFSLYFFFSICSYKQLVLGEYLKGIQSREGDCPVSSGNQGKWFNMSENDCRQGVFIMQKCEKIGPSTP